MAKFGEICSGLAQPIQAKLGAKKELTDISSKIRIGIISSFICSHPVWHAITKGWVNHLDDKQFELHIFNTNGVEDQETEKAKSRVASYMNCGTDIMVAAQTIADHKLDIILYPEIGMDTISKSLACLRLAPTQIVSWGHPETTGLPTIDFYLSSQLMESADSNDYYSEKLITLPSLGTYFEQEVVEPIKPDLQSLGINPNTPILLCAGSPSKYSPAHDHVFVQIAKKLGACQLVFFNFDENLTVILRERLQLAFAREQLDSTQYLRFIPFLNKQEFYGLMREANLYLDTIGFSGFNTAMQALVCDLPIITIAGTKMRGRLASAILDRIGLPELICRSNTAYIDLAVEFIQNRNLLNSIKDKIAKSKAILFNDIEPIRSLEQFLIQQARK
jgi:predicted O-linked N-acetylglucosamine transferase (SPINDLY family)